MESPILLAPAAADALRSASPVDARQLITTISTSLSKELSERVHGIPDTTYKVLLAPNGYGIVYRPLLKAEWDVYRPLLKGELESGSAESQGVLVADVIPSLGSKFFLESDEAD